MPAGLKTKNDKCPVIPVLAPFLPGAAGEGKKEATGNAPMESLTRKALGRARGRGGGGATRSVEVGVGILPPEYLVVVVAVLLVTPARGGIFIVGGALHIVLLTSSKISKDRDGEQAALH